MPLPPGESFAFSGVPEGTYTFRLRAVNAAGVSAPSAPVTQTFPGPCSGVPRQPANFSVARGGSTLFVSWDTPEGGGAVSTYVLNVAGPIAASLRTTQRALSGQVPPGIYQLNVAAMNACGIGPATEVVTVKVP